MSFDTLGLASPLLRAVSAEGYEIPTPIQAQAIPPLVAGEDLLGVAQTGTGKTAAFALPVLHRLIEGGVPARHAKRHIRALVLAPTRELAIQIRESFRVYGGATHLRSTVVMGGVKQGNQVRALQQGVDILIATPGRLVDLRGQGYIDLSHVETFVVDEADRMLDMGFLPDVQRIAGWLPEERQTAMFSATMPAPIVQLTQKLLTSPVKVRIEPERNRQALIEASVVHVDQKAKSDLLVAMLRREASSRAVVFTRTKHGADKVAKHLSKEGIAAEAMHGNKSQNARQRILNSFRSDRPPVLIATDVAARGLDVDDVSHVFNFDLPTEPETYVHRIGRTGRAGAEGRAISFCAGDERGALLDIERLIGKRVRVEQVDGFETPVEEAPAFRGPRRGAPRKRGMTSSQREFKRGAGPSGPGRPASGGPRPARPFKPAANEGSTAGPAVRFVRPEGAEGAEGPRKKFAKRRPATNGAAPKPRLNDGPSAGAAPTGSRPRPAKKARPASLGQKPAGGGRPSGRPRPAGA